MLSGYLERLKRSQRYLAVLIVLSLVVTFIVPLGLIENADSKTGQLICGMVAHTHNEACDYGTNCTITPHTHTEACYRKVTLISAAGTAAAGYLQTNAAKEDGNIVNSVTYSPKEVELLKLLFGVKNDGTPLDWMKDASTLDEALRAAEDEYFLGMASDFCAFIEGDFVPTEADAEGRVAVGGNLMFQQTGSSIWNYQIASGDYQSMTPIHKTGPYQGITGFASALVGGKLYRINTLSTGNKAVQTTGAITSGAHISGDTVYYTPENGGFKSFLVGNVSASRHWDGDNGQDIPYSTSCHHDYPSDCDTCAKDITKHAYLGTVNELAQLYEYNPVDGYTDIRQIITTVFSEIRSRSQGLSQVKGIPGVVSGNTVTFTYTGAKDVDTVYFELDSWDKAWNAVEFVGIPQKADGSPVSIIVNCGGEAVELRGDGNNFATTINGKGIHNQANSGMNNHEWSSCVLYNFYNATTMTLDGNFNGTVLAPNADVTSDKGECSGHLSGALIAKSFEGGLEFGYRPYRGGSDILGLVSEYAMPVDKLNGNGEFLSGAALKIEQSLDNGSTFSTFMEHITNGKTWWVPLQSMIDYSGETKYLPELKGNDTMTVGDTQTLTVTNGAGEIQLQGGSWSNSGQDSIATVDNTGVVTAVGAGTVTIALSFGGKSFTKDIKVSYDPLKINSSLASELYESESLDLSGQATGGAGTYTWSVDNTSVATIVGNKLYANVNIDTDTTVTLTVKDAAENSVTHTVKIKPLQITTNSAMDVGREYDLNLNSGKAADYNWSSSSDAVTISGTKATAVSEASGVTIGVAKDGITYATLNVDVKDAIAQLQFSSDLPKEVYEGETISLEGKLTGGSGSLTWSSDNPAAVISGNTITTPNVDSDTPVNITVTDNDDSTNTATYRFTIKPVTITATNSTIIVNGEPNSTVLTITKGTGHTLTSSDESGTFVTLSDMTVTAKAAGTVTYSLVLNGVTYSSVEITVKSAASQGGEGDVQLPVTLNKGESFTINLNNTTEQSIKGLTLIVTCSDYATFDFSMLNAKNDVVANGNGGGNNGTLNAYWIPDNSAVSALKITASGDPSFTMNSYTITYSDGTTETYAAEGQITPMAMRAKGIRKAAFRAVGDSMTQTFTQQYRITEVQPPEGYIGDATVYTVKVSETIDLTQIATGQNGNHHYPKSTITKMEFYKDGSSVPLHTVEWEISDEYNDNLTNTRTVTINGCTFVMVIDSVKQAVTELRVNGTKQEDISLTEPAILTAGGSQFRFDPEHMMVVPALAAKQNATVQFTNRAGVMFKKLDDANEPVTNATIKMSKLVGDTWTEITDTTIFNADAVKENAFTVMNLDTYLGTAGEYIFRFEETQTPNGYQTAAPVYFKITVADDLNATYSISSDNATWNQLQPLGGDHGYYLIPMVDKPQYGVKLALKKVDGEDHSIALQGAKFALYAADHTLVYPTDTSTDNLITTGADGTVDLSSLIENNPSLTNSQYIKEGFLKVGEYYLREIGAPTNPDKQYVLPTETYAFLVKKKANGNYTLKAVIDTGSTKVYDLDQIAWSIDGEGIPSVTVDELTLYYLDGTNATINNVVCSSCAKWWSPLNLGDLSLDDVVGVKLKTGGSGRNNIQFQTADKVKLWAGDDYGNIGLDSNSSYQFGDCNGTNYIQDYPYQAINNSVLQIANDTLGDKVNYRVEKHWEGDSDLLIIRPSMIQVELWRSTDAAGSTNAERVSIDGKDRVELTAEDNWTHLWKDLPRQSEDGQLYYYFVKEVEDATLSSRYTLSYGDSQPSNVGGIYVITNTLKTADLDVTKTWDYSGYKNVNLPNALHLQLQWKNGDQWEDVPGKVLILRKTSGWKGTFSNLPVGKEYRVREMNLPYGWEMTANSTATLEEVGQGKKIELKNTFKIEQSSLSVSKNWENNTEDELPKDITLNLYQSVIAPNSQYSDMPYGDDPTSVQRDYARLLQYSLYFYDANMCGDQAQQNSAVSWRGNCHTEDEVQGGYHDAGDHVMFGLAQGYAASTVGWGYYAFKDAYDALGQTEHYKIIMKQFCDFFVNATELNADGTVKRMLYQKGSGGIDHAYWGAPENQDDRSDQMYWVTEGAGDVAAEYAAALALQALNFPDDPQHDTYLKYAKALFDFAKRNGATVGAQHTGFYSSSSFKDDQAWAAGWLCLADPANKDSYTGTLNNCDASNYHHWDDVSIGAAYLKGVVNNDWNSVKNFLNGFIDSKEYKLFNKWGSARHNATAQLVALATAKALESSDADFANRCKTWAQGQMDMLLGNNTWNNGESVCLVTGFAPNSAKWAHHRAASGYDSDAEFEVNTTYDKDGHVLIGGLVGGPAFGDHSDQSSQLAGYPELMKYHEYLDHVQDYCCNEVSIDFNAGLVGAAAGLYSFYETGELSTVIEGIETVYLPAGYNGNTKGNTSGSSSSSSSSSSTSGQSNTHIVTSGISYTIAGHDDYYQVELEQLPVPAQDASPRYIYLTASALGLEGVKVDSIKLEFTASNFGETNGGVYLNGTGDDNKIGEYKPSNKTVTYATAEPTTINSLMVDSWWRDGGASDLKVKITIRVPVSGPSIASVPKTLLLNGTAKLNAVGFTGGSIQWESSDSSVISVDANGKVTANNYGVATITASAGSQRVTATIAVKVPLGIDKTLIRGNGTAQLTSVDGAAFTVEPEGIVTINESGVVKPVDGKAGTVTIRATKNGAESDAVQLTVKPLLSGTYIINTNSRVDMDELLADSLVGQATWSVKAGDGYTATSNASGTMITITKGTDKILTLSTKTGVVNTYAAEGQVTLEVTDSFDTLSGEVVLTVKQAPSIAEIPAMRTNLIGKIKLTATGATLTLVGNGMNTDSIQLSEASKTAAWSAVLENLCRYDEMGNTYYYYIEEVAENGRFTAGTTEYIVSGYNNGVVLNADGSSAASVSVTNTSTGKVKRPLPSTGGEGKANIYVVGVCIMLLGGVGIIGLKRRRASPR